MSLRPFSTPSLYDTCVKHADAFACFSEGVTNPRTIAISSDSSISSSVSNVGHNSYRQPRHRNHGTHKKDLFYSRNQAYRSLSTTSSSSGDEFVFRVFHRQYTDMEQKLGSALKTFHHLTPPLSHSRRHIHIDTADEAVSSLSSSALAEDAAYLQRLRKGLVEMRLSSQTPPAGENPKLKRKIRKDTIDRLTVPNASTKAKMQEKYLKRIDRAKEEKAKAAPISLKATKAGARLFMQAKEQQKMHAQLQAEAAINAVKKETEACSFKPKITTYAKDLAAQHGYRTLENRLSVLQRQEEERQKERLEHQAAALRQFSHQPKLSRGTERIWNLHRQKCHSGDSRSGTGGGRPQRRRHSCTSAEAGERLYRDGVERLLRHQIRARLVAKEHEVHIVGSRCRLSSERIAQMIDSLETWQQTRDCNIALLRAEAERRSKESGGKPVVALVEQQVTPSRPATDKTPSTTHTLWGDKPKRVKTKKTTHAWHAENKRGLSLGSRTSSAELDSTITVSALSTMPSLPTANGMPSRQQLLYQEMRRIRLGALFYKYAPTPRSQTLCVKDLREKVLLLYPEDAGVAEALHASIQSDVAPITKEHFVKSLEDFEQQHGPQPWGRTEKDKILFPSLQMFAGPPVATSTVELHRDRITTPHHLKRSATASPVPKAGVYRETPPSADGEFRDVKSKNTPTQSPPCSLSVRHPSPSAIRGCSARHGQRRRNSTRCWKCSTLSSMGPDWEECVFAPKLSKRTIELSNAEQECRLNNARGLQQCRQEQQRSQPAKNSLGRSRKESQRKREPSTCSAASSTPGLSPSTKLSNRANCSPPMVQADSLNVSLSSVPLASGRQKTQAAAEELQKLLEAVPPSQPDARKKSCAQGMLLKLGSPPHNLQRRQRMSCVTETNKDAEFDAMYKNVGM